MWKSGEGLKSARKAEKKMTNMVGRKPKKRAWSTITNAARNSN